MKLTNSKFIIHNSTLLLILSLTLFISCDTTNPPSNKIITIEFEDASCTEAWLNLKTENISLPAEIEIIQNDSAFISVSINSNDTTLFIENLLPNQTYNFHSTIHPYNQSILKSNSVTVNTMDTTSHNFTWQTFTFGNHNSVLYDVAIINENNIWAVGEIRTDDTGKFDSNGVWVQHYNAVHWDGVKWELKRILVDYKGNIIFLALESIFAFSPTDIWLVSSLPIHGDGENWKIYDVREIINSDLSLTNVWGSDANDIYFAGRSGSLAHYNGENWRKIESGTELSISSIYGSLRDDAKYCTAISGEYGIESYILKLDKNNNISKEYLSTDRHFGKVWTKSGFPIYLCGDGIFTNKSGLWKNDLPNNIYYVSDIGGNNLNDIITCGAFGFLAHNNGVSWKTYPVMIENSYYSVDIKENIVAATGFSGGKAEIVIGRR